MKEKFGVIWGVWHLPSFFVGGMVQTGLSLPLFLLNAIFLSIFVTWIFLHTGGSVFISMLDKQFGWFHSSDFEHRILSVGGTK